jgi:uncharacterized protein YjdB
VKKHLIGVSRAARALALLLLTTCNGDVSGPAAPNKPGPIQEAVIPPSAALLIGAGDIARCDRTNDEATGLLLDNYPTATVFTAGDNTNGNATLTNFNNCYGPSWGRNKARTRPAVGNNDYKVAGAGGYFSYFGSAAGDSAKYYYSYNLAGWHVMVLNDQITMTAGSAQDLWLRADLAANTRKCTLAIWHRPRFSSTGTNDLAAVKPFWDALYAYNADVVVNANYFVYERFAPQSPTAVADPLGIREFIAGTGGINLQNPGAPKPNSQVRNGTTYGVLKFVLDTANYSWEFVPIAGSTFSDTGTTACHTRIAVASVDVSPTTASLHPGQTVQLTATPKDAGGTPLTGRTVTWTTSDATIATVNATGLVTAVAAGGPVTITATSEGKTGTSAVTVSPTPVATVTVTPPSPSIVLGTTVQLTATPKDSNGNTLTGRTVTWATGNANLATTSASGLVTGTGVGGPVTITATIEGQSGTSAVTVTPVPIASVAVTPSPASVIVGATVQLTATPKDASGNPLTGRVVTWATSDATTATVDANGLVTGKVVGGPVTVTATSEGVNGTASITVIPVPVASVDVTPPSASILVGGTTQLTATPRDANGNALTGRTVTWSTSNAGIATVDANGLVTGQGAGGPVSITATSEGKSGTSAITVALVPIASVDVSPPTATIQVSSTVPLTATPKDVNGNPLTGRTVTWTTSDATIATVDANGVVTGKAAGGPVTITATSEGKSGTAAITVIPIPVASVAVTPASATIPVGTTVQLSATPKDANGNPLSGRAVTWTTSDGTIATVDANGLVTAQAIGGPVTITATSEGKTGTSAVTVIPVPVASVDVTPASATIQVGNTVQLTATPKDGAGNPLTGRTVTWTTNNATVATVNASGLVTGAGAGGPVTITATSEGKNGTSAITVTPIPVAAVAITPPSATIQVGATVQLTASLTDANGNPLTGRAITWSTSDATVATVNASGLVTGVAAGGPVTITATSEGKSSTTSITVIPIPVATVAVTPPSATVPVGTTLQLSATTKDANGNTLTGRTVAWTTSNAGIASVDVNGLVTGRAAGGPVTITATSEGKSGASQITVSAFAPVASVSVTPPSSSVQVGSMVQLTATTLDANGNLLTGRAITWQSGTPGVATVSGSGLVQAVAPGTASIIATSEGVTGSALVTVTPVPVARVDVTPSSATIPANSTLQLSASPKDATGNVLTGRAVTWASSAPAVAQVTANGFVVGLTAGTANITATSEGIVGTAALTVQAASGPPVIAGAGDIADCSRASQEATAKLLDNIAGTVVTFGDMAYNDGTLTNFMQCYDPSWGRHKARTRPAPGNHEYNLSSNQGVGYGQYFGAAAGPVGKYYYSYDLGAWHIVVINNYVDMSAGSPQEQWLRADLAAHPAVCTLAYWHQPRFSSGGNGSDVTTQPIWQALYDYGADVVLNGHDHDYERFAPQTPTGAVDNVNGIKEFVVGTGGNSLYSWPGNPIANSELRSNVNYGVIKLTLWPTSYDWQFVPVAGGTFSDQGSALCHAGTPPPNQAPVANPGGPYFVEGTTVQLDGSQSRDPDNNTPLTYAWNLGDGTTANAATVTHTYPGQGVYVVTLTVTDSKGLSSTPTSTSLTIGNVAPTVNAGPDQSVLGGTPLNLPVTFSDPGTDSPWSYSITWGDGTTSTGSTITQTPISASHLYPGPGQYTAQVTMTDGGGAAGSAGIVVKVLDPATVQVFSGASNIASCGTDEDEATAEIIDTLPGTVFVVGDNVNPSGSDANYTNCYGPTWGRHKARTRAVVGNHDYDVPGAEGFYNYFKPSVGDSAKYYYSFDLGPYWHVIVLNNTASVSTATGSVEEQWLQADLAANTKKCTIAMFHYPLWFSSDDPSWHSASGVIPIWLDLYNAGADIVINGQDYFYERFAPQDAGGSPDPGRGIREFEVGMGGYATSMPSSVAPNNEALSDNFGVLKLTLGPDSYIWDFIPAPGYTFRDHGSGNCH